MGCGSPSKYEHIYTTVRGVSDYRRDFTALGIGEEDIGKLFWIFCKIDTDGSRLIEIIELLMFLDVERTRFTKRIFSIFDDDKSGKIDFREFVLSVWNYCTLGKISLIIFAFDIYDQDKSGYIDIKEAQNLVKDVYGTKYEQNVHAKRVHAKLEELDRQNIDLATFQKFAEKHQALLYPAFDMQTRIQDHVIGTTFWHILIDNRIKMFEDRYIPIREILARYEERVDLNRVTKHSQHEEMENDNGGNVTIHPPPTSSSSSSSHSHHDPKKMRRFSNSFSSTQSHEDGNEEHVPITADGHESIKSLSRKLTMKSISVSPIVQSILAEEPAEMNPKSHGKSHGLTADGLASAHPVVQRKPSNAGRNDLPAKTKFKSAAQAVAVSAGTGAEKKRRKSEFRH